MIFILKDFSIVLSSPTELSHDLDTFYGGGNLRLFVLTESEAANVNAPNADGFPRSEGQRDNFLWVFGRRSSYARTVPRWLGVSV